MTSTQEKLRVLRRLYASYRQDPAFSHMRAAVQGVVRGRGDVDGRLMFVGEAPGRTEDYTGQPFVGASGRLLDKMLRSVGIEREEVFITNAVKYRPVTEDGNNRTPTPAEVKASVPYLVTEWLTLGKPAVICLGKSAALAVAGEPLPVGQWRTVKGWGPVLALRHPAFGIYQQANRPIMFEQFKEVLKLCSAM